MSNINWRTINIDALDPESATNFDLSTLTPNVQPVSTSDVQTLAGQVRQLLRGGDQEGALIGALENVPYGADDRGKVGSIFHTRWSGEGRGSTRRDRVQECGGTMVKKSCRNDSKRSQIMFVG